MKDEKNIDELAEELTQKYFQRFGTFTCSWENVREILRERIEIEQSLKEQNKNLRCCGNCKNLICNQKNGKEWCQKTDSDLFECDIEKDWSMKE